MSIVVDESLPVFKPMFCYENTFNYYVESQQNEKSTQVYTRKLWKGSLVGAATVGEMAVKDIVTTVIIEGSLLDALAKGLYWLVSSSTQEERILAAGLGQSSTGKKGSYFKKELEALTPFF